MRYRDPMAAGPPSRPGSSDARVGRHDARLLLGVALCVLAACARTPLVLPPPDDGGPGPGTERCNQLDDDADLEVDEDYRDEAGNFIHVEHCGACDRACDAPIANAERVGCALLQGVPSCVAERCAADFGPTHAGGCAALDERLCLSCLDDGDCGALTSARCTDIGGEQRCTRGCGEGCPAGYACAGAEHCVPMAQSCSCQSSAGDFTLACQLDGAATDCPGSARCEDGVQSACRAPEELCDGLDNDCDLAIDETFVDELGAYSRDPANCGACGVDCGADSAAGVALVCGGDPFAPTCVNDCPDAADGIQRGDMLDADRVITNGCECEVRALLDESGEAPGDGRLDSNCDGADGSVLSSIYVATSGDDAAPGSPTRPLRSIDVAVRRAFDSLRSSRPRPHVFVASGIYTETIHMRDGVSLHGGYRSDFLARNPDGFEVIVVAPADTDALAGAALVIEDAGGQATVVESLTLRGRDALAPSAPALGVLIDRARSGLVLRDLRVRAGQPGAGANGTDGAAGPAPQSSATDGQPPRAALEDSAHVCAIAAAANRVNGGRGATNVCAGLDVSGGNGGSPVCPQYGASSPGGETGRGGGLAGGGGPGGHDVAGPIMGGTSCPSGVCCGLADFSVPNPFQQTQPGQPGGDGTPGSAGAGCDDALGGFGLTDFMPSAAAGGARGAPGRGGGGGGGGGGAEITWSAASCEFADGLGGGGGGGGAGGCGGDGGAAGGAGGPSIGILIRAGALAELPLLEAIEVTTADGARGGDGGAGGDGAPGSQGGFGGSVPDVMRSTPSLAGPMAGERGGKGGDGGGGGGGGGGCGGSSIGVWVTGLGDQPGLRDRFAGGNAFALGAAGQPGRGGGGVLSGAAGALGQRAEVVVR